MPLPDNHPLSPTGRRILSSDRPYDVLAFIGSLDIGGCERHVATMFPRLVQEGLKAGIVTLSHDGTLAQEVRAGGVDVFCIRRPPPRYWVPYVGGLMTHGLMIWDVYRILRSGQVRVAHFFLPGAYVLGGLAAYAARFGNRVMSRRSLNNYQQGHPYATRIEKFLHPRMPVLTANSQAAVEQLVEEGAPRERCIVLYNGVGSTMEGAPDREAARRSLNVGSEALVLAIVANLIPYKGHMDLIEALGRVRASMPAGWVLLIAGRDQGLGRDIERAAVQHGILENIRLLGQRSDVPTIFSAADIGLLVSHQEGMPNALLEGMAAGLPMIATRVGGVSEVARHDVDALLVPPHDPERLGGTIVRLANDQVLRRRIGAEARRRVQDVFSLDRSVASYQSLYGPMLKSSRPEAGGTL